MRKRLRMVVMAVGMAFGFALLFAGWHAYLPFKNDWEISPELVLDDKVHIKLPVRMEEFEKAGYWCEKKNVTVNAHHAEEYTLKKGEGRNLKAVFCNPYDIDMPLGELPVTAVYVESNQDIRMGDCKIGADKKRFWQAQSLDKSFIRLGEKEYSMYIVFNEDNRVKSFMYSYLGEGWWRKPAA